ncbi:MAG TPA: peptidoglycan recognition family protein [Planctomycetota bacterium]|nr:peptidoglycan recognition family protein [Planctomycetota bacterium]
MPSRRAVAPVLSIIAALACAEGCSVSRGRPGDPLPRAGDEMSAAGVLFHTGTRVVLWNDPGGFDAYRHHRRFEPEKAGPRQAPDRVSRYGSFRGGLPEDVARRIRERGWSIEELRRTVRQVVIHFDACGSSRRCFEVLHDIRGLSSHFLLDLDGTVYQTLDLKERAWHAAEANDLSIGIEIANIGAHGDEEALRRWYTRDAEGTRITFPKELGDPGLPADFVGRPRRADPVRGVVNGKDLVQYDFTEEQYRALESLLLALSRVFPRIRADAPRGAGGKVLDHAIGSEALKTFEGLIGHHHVTVEKVDPGPAFDWERVIDHLRREGVPGGAE